MIANVVDEFLKQLKDRYGKNSGAFREVCLHHLKACREIRAARDDLENVVVVSLADPRYQWLVELSELALRGLPDLSRLFITPSCNQADLLVAIAESLQDDHCAEWVMGKAFVDRDLIAGLDATTRLRREVWSALKMVRGNVELVRPTFLCWQGENLLEVGLYEMQDLANRTGWRFVILAGTMEPLTFQDQFVNGAGKHLARFRSVSPAMVDLDLNLLPQALIEVRRLVEAASQSVDGCSAELVFDALISSLEA